MKKIIAITAVMAFFGSVASAELLKNFKYDGSIEVNAYNTSNTFDYNKKADDKTGNVDSRVMINASFDLNNDASAFVSVVKNNRKYGDASEDANTIQSSLFFEQAYLNLKGVFGMDHKLGRQYYGKSGDLVVYFGPLMWPYDNGMIVNAIDGWTGWYKTGNWDIHAILATEVNSVAAPTNKDVRLSGINASTKIDRWNLNAYYYNENDKSSGKSNYLGVLGARANWECMFVKGLNLGLEYDMNMGKDTTVAVDNEHQGYAYKVNADYSMDIMGKLGLEAEYLFASGDEKPTDKKDEEYTSINGDYRPGIINGGGFNTYATGSGSVIYGLGANWTPEKLNKLNVAAKYYDFSADKKVALTKKHEGAELDLVATWNHSENVSVKGYYAMFTPEKKNNTNDDAATMLGAAFNVKF
ncbi:MAG: hypothetical protein Fur0012_06520 [Elusimicrobiota bacterium]